MYVLGIFEFANQLYRSTVGGSATMFLSSTSKPFRVRIKRNGNDFVVVTRSTAAPPGPTTTRQQAR